MNSKPEFIHAGDRTIRVYRQHRQSLVMRTTPVGLVMFVPQRLNLQSDRAQTFIADALNRIGGRVTRENSPIVTTPDELRGMVRLWAERVGVSPSRVSLREMFRKWGSCTSKGNINLNSALCRVPRELAEYVVCHEVVHLIELNHGKGFQALMDRHMPDWRAREAALDAWMAGELQTA